jgi:hypothetical protein
VKKWDWLRADTAKTLEISVREGACPNFFTAPEGPLRTPASARGPPGRTPQVPDEPRDLELVLDPEFL